MKKIIITIILTAIITSIFSLSFSYAATNYAISASKIGYTDNSSLGAVDVQAAIDGTCTKFSSQLINLKNEVKTETINEMYPVGSIYISLSEEKVENVENKYGGTWERITDKFLVGAGNLYDGKSTGGSITHNHKSPLTWIQGQSTTDSWVGTTNYYGYTVVENRDFYGTSITKVDKDTVTKKLVYNTSTESNIPPYLAVYMYKRTA
mgnify:CR=1 FL=1